MASEHGDHFTAFATEYDAILAQARDTVAGFPSLLQAVAEPLLPELGGGSFSRIVALLPYWVADLLDPPEPAGFTSANAEQVASTSSPSRLDEAETLGLATLLGWWSYLIQDGLLDRNLDRPELLPLAMALHMAAVRLLEGLLPGDHAFWDAFEALSLTAAEAHCWEQGWRFGTLTDLDGLDPKTFGLDDLDRLAERSALLQLAVVAQLRLRGYDQDRPLGRALAEMLRHYAIARQIGDDLADWVDDLQDGRLNYASARIVQRMVETGAVQACAELNVERMVGYFLYDDDLLSGIQRVALASCRRAARSIAPYGSAHLEALVGELEGTLARGYETTVEGRRRLRAVFTP